jgi:hypothetical protein
MPSAYCCIFGDPIYGLVKSSDILPCKQQDVPKDHNNEKMCIGWMLCGHYEWDDQMCDDDCSECPCP